MRSRMVWKICGVAITLALGGPCSGQSWPTPTRYYFHFPTDCMQMADKKAGSMTERLLTGAETASIGLKPADVALMNKLAEQRMTYEKAPSHASYYDVKDRDNQKRCYIKVSQ